MAEGFKLERQGSDGERRLVLLAEDDELLRAMYCNLLLAVHDVVACEDGQAMLDYMDRAATGELPYPHVLITDQLMPRLTGLEALTAVRRRDPSIPALLVTGQTDLQTRERARQLNVSAMSKPTDPDVLAHWISQAHVSGG